jgi:hypothetical protein
MSKTCVASISGWCRIGLSCGHSCKLPDGHGDLHECSCGFKWSYPPRQAWETPDITDPAMDQEPFFEQFFPTIRDPVERYGRACFNSGLKVGLRAARDLKVWLTAKPGLSRKQLAKCLEQAIHDAESKRHTK